MRKYILGVALLTLVAASCNKDKDMTNATVIDTGDIASEGCGYILKLDDGSELRPMYLPTAFQHNGFKVKVKYSTNNEQFVCKVAPVNKVYEMIEISDIKRDLD